MNAEQLRQRLAAVCAENLPFPGLGATVERHRRLMEVGREDLTLAKLVEAHWDAVAILGEAGHSATPGQIYGVWASEVPGHTLTLIDGPRGFLLSGRKMFASGAGIVDRVLVTVSAPARRLVEVNISSNSTAVEFDCTGWKTDAFRLTRTGLANFHSVPVAEDSILGPDNWYVERPGFWHGACGPAACWAGGAIGLLDYALLQSRSDPHTLAHLGAMAADAWALETYLTAAAEEIDRDPTNRIEAQKRALRVRHLVEQACTDMLRRFTRGWGPSPLSLHADSSRRYHELDLYLRQSHAERDLEALGRCLERHG